MNNSKVRTFIGFSVKAGKLRPGNNTLSTLKKAYLILVSCDAAAATKENAVKYGKKYRCAVLESKDVPLEEYINKSGVKIAAVTDAALAKAIKDNSETEFNAVC